MDKFTEDELINFGFIPSPQRSQFKSMPFQLPLSCSIDVYNRLPLDIQGKYTVNGDWANLKKGA